MAIQTSDNILPLSTQFLQHDKTWSNDEQKTRPRANTRTTRGTYLIQDHLTSPCQADSELRNGPIR